MFIKRNRTKHNDKPYQFILLVQGKRVPAKRPPGRPAAGAPPRKTVVVHETLANLSRLPAAVVDLIERFCHGARPETTATPPARAGAPRRRAPPCRSVLATACWPGCTRWPAN